MPGLALVLGLPREVAEPTARRMLAALAPRGRGDLAVIEAGPDAPPAVLVQVDDTGRGPTVAGRRAAALDGEVEALDPTSATAGDADLDGAAPPSAVAGRGPAGRLLEAWVVRGEPASDRLRGAIAAVVVDGHRRAVWLLRGPVGIRPLFLARAAGGQALLVASSVAALLAAGPDLLPARLDPAGLEAFLAQGAPWGRRTFVRGVELLEPGTSLLLDWSGSPTSVRATWHLPFAPAGAAAPRDRRRAVEGLRSALRVAVWRALGEAPTAGLLLSSGVDSAALGVVATELQTLETVCLVLEGAPDESEGAQATALALGARHTTVRLGGDALRTALTAGLDAQDQPTLDLAGAHLLATAARQAGLRAALIGLGGDEVVGGHGSHRDVPRVVRARQLTRFMDRFERVPPLAAKLLGGRRGGRAAHEPDALELYLLRRELFLPEDRRGLHALPEGSDPTTGVPDDAAAGLRALARGLDPSTRIAAFELGGWLRHGPLRDADVLPPHAGVTLRAPLVDAELLQLLAACPLAWRLKDPRPKPLLQDAVGLGFPARLRRQPKRSLGLAWSSWLLGLLRPTALEAVHAREAWLALGVDPAAPLDLWRRFAGGDQSVDALHVLALVTLARWALRTGVQLG